MELTLGAIKREVRQMDPALRPGDDEYRTAILLLAGLQLGTKNLGALATFTQLPVQYVRVRAKRLRAAGVWTEDGLTACQWFDEGGGIAFWMDVCVAEGLMARVPAVAQDVTT